VSDLFGPLEVPIVAPSPGQAAGDPFLSTTLAFAQAILNANAPAAWQAVYKDVANAQVVKTVSTEDPEDTRAAFSDARLPALFMWRQTVKPPVWIAEDYLTRESTCILEWVMPAVVRERRALRATVINSIATTLLLLSERNRDPSWVVAGDPDPKAATQGSLFSAWAGFFEFEIDGWKPYVVRIKALDPGAQPRPYDALRTEVRVVEHLQPDVVGRFGPTTTASLTLRTPDGGVGDGGVVTGSEILGEYPYSIWAPVTPYAVNAYVSASNAPSSLYFKCTTAGVSGATPPLWRSGVGMTVQDGSVVWTVVSTVP
jgi:hypothetical protein